MVALETAIVIVGTVLRSTELARPYHGKCVELNIYFHYLWYSDKIKKEGNHRSDLLIPGYRKTLLQMKRQTIV